MYSTRGPGDSEPWILQGRDQETPGGTDTRENRSDTQVQYNLFRVCGVCNDSYLCSYAVWLKKVYCLVNSGVNAPIKVPKAYIKHVRRLN